MNDNQKIAVVVGLVITVTLVLILKGDWESNAVSDDTAVDSSTDTTDHASEPSQIANPVVVPADGALPRMIELGRDTCKPCKMMKPIIADLKREYEGRLIVETINTQKNPEIAKKFGIKVIPTQIFLDPSGEEIFRHEGFYPKKEILAQWEKLGFDFDAVE